VGPREEWRLRYATNCVAVPLVFADDGVMDQVREALEPLLGRPAWLVQRGYGSFVTMEFGEPAVEVGEPRLRPLAIEGAPSRVMRRTAHVRGQWHLWIYCCLWSVLLDGTELAGSESSDVMISRALAVVNGQALSGVHVRPANGSTQFAFDLGCVLATHPAPPGSYDDEPVEQWMLYQWQPPDQVLAVRSDGTYQVSGLGQAADEERWLPLPETRLGLPSGQRR
jgi:hypothetical protein